MKSVPDTLGRRVQRSYSVHRCCPLGGMSFSVECRQELSANVNINVCTIRSYSDASIIPNPPRFDFPSPSVGSVLYTLR